MASWAVLRLGLLKHTAATTPRIVLLAQQPPAVRLKRQPVCGKRHVRDGSEAWSYVLAGRDAWKGGRMAWNRASAQNKAWPGHHRDADACIASTTASIAADTLVLRIADAKL
ncbi:uncharacterized protein TrAFT101_010654 [Trichoderma asperellum]|uniref:Secreted protein n=1 Tax=Trichoderma asperellum (strain ATCC 204424 / CBS 433.97 / NBRC 101777) TaxID=1042311 RepID=A0A2T3YTH1_TRIA4|nr:hypothetical protein M441DRAFT_294046 [Trichoderma asperellum CBS 433.97]PTB35804.1 hypothetical protein M441DRAFT_294046 [Trichoderma asperellum CBS 433.97]UKZ95840.1 hypothetical protein TrAFT101_010654 [Trichoderma asperellum]